MKLFGHLLFKYFKYSWASITVPFQITEERLLGNEDKPLLERLELGADDQGAKIFLKERQMAPAVTSPDAAIQLPIVEEEEETLPDEVGARFVVYFLIFFLWHIVFDICLKLKDLSMHKSSIDSPNKFCTGFWKHWARCTCVGGRVDFGVEECGK